MKSPRPKRTYVNPTAAQRAALENRPAEPEPELPQPSLDGLNGWGFRVFCAVSLVALLPYFVTAPAGLQFGDGTELATSAWVLGVPHPTGYPLYMILLHLWMKVVMIGEPILRSVLFNMVCMAMAGGITGAMALRIIRTTLPGWADKTKILAAVSVGLLLPVLRFPWAAAIITEVYALQLLLALALLLSLSRLSDAPTLRRWIVVVVLVGFNLAHHRLGLFPALVAVLWILTLRNILGARRLWIGLGAIVAIPLVLYLYLPLRAQSHPPINWGNTRTFSAALTHARGGEYIRDRFLKAAPGQDFTQSTYRQFAAYQTGQYLSDLATMWGAPRQNEQLRFDPVTAREFPQPRGFAGWILALSTVALALYGSWRIFGIRTLRPWLFGTVLCAGGTLATGYLYNIRDIRDYNLLLVWASSLLSVFGALFLVQDHFLRSRGIQPPGQARWLWLLLPALVTLGNLPEQRVARAYSEEAELMASIVLPEDPQILPTNSILITTGDDEIFLSWYRQHVRGLRPDVLIFGGNFVSVPWYRGFFTDQQIRDFSLKFAPRVALNPEEFTEQVDDGVIRANIGKRPIFTSSTDRLFLDRLFRRYELRPVLEAPIRLRLVDDPVTASLYRILPRPAPGT